MEETKSYHQFTNYKDFEDFKRLDFIVESINSLNSKNISVLDIGCGNGNIAMALGAVGYNVKGIDIDKNSIELASNKNTLPNVKFEVYDANSFTINNSFDAIVCSEVLEHLDKPWELVASVFNILKPGGVFVATVPNGFGPREVLITKPMQWLHRKNLDKSIISFKKMLGYGNTTLQSSNADLTHTQFFTKGKFAAMLLNAGFKELRWNNADFIERIFPYSWLTKRIYFLQKLDCAFADHIPKQLTSGFYTAWTK
jgi:2-polyprenyl-3-methyl-5-hydroxy-6-metoxy-1,4-benzoquinol methylase